MPSHVYRVADAGSTAGVVVLPWRNGQLTIDVLPKFWGSHLTSVVELGGAGPNRVTVRETGRMVVRGTADELAEFARLLVTTFEIGSDADDLSYRRPLFSLVRIGEDTAEESVASDLTSVSSFWDLAFNFATDGVFIRDSLRAMSSNQEISAYLADSGLAGLPELRSVLRRLFLSECALVLCHRPYQARIEVLPLSAPRGRVIVRDMPNRPRRVGAAVLCERASVDQDDPWSRLIRCALRSVAADENVPGNERAQALALDRMLHGVALVRAVDASAAIRGKPVPRKYARLSRLSGIAEALLRELPQFGAAAGLASQGVVVTLLVDTSRLFECVVREAASELGLQVSEKPYFGIWRGRPASKRPDLVVEDHLGPRLLVDAKYKGIDSMASMPSSDQYQQFAYAAVSRVPTLFAYAQSESDSRADVWNEFRIANTEAADVLGCTIVPFPTVESVIAGSWKRTAATGLASAMTGLQTVSNDDTGASCQ